MARSGDAGEDRHCLLRPQTKNLCPLKSSWHGADSPHCISRQRWPLKSRQLAWEPITSSGVPTLSQLVCPLSCPVHGLGHPLSQLVFREPAPPSMSKAMVSTIIPPPPQHHCHFINTQPGPKGTQPLNKRSTLS